MLLRLHPVWLLTLAACPPSDFGTLPPECDPETEQCPPPPATTSGTDTTTDATPTGGVQTVTGSEPTSAGTSSSTDTPDGTTTGEPAVPEILDVVFDPDPLEKAGVIHVDVTASRNTSAVDMALKDATVITLTPAPGNHFLGEIEILSGTQNGEHEATFTPTGEGDPGIVQTGLYHVALPPPGEEAAWDAPPDLGLAEVRGVGVTSDRILEFGSRQDNGESRCYLRRRDLVGAYGDADIMDVLPGKRCVATDIAVGPADEVYLLADLTTAGTTRWWLGQLTAWNTTIKLDEGAAGEVARALTLGPNGEIVACGHTPTEFKDVDARYWLRFPGGFGWNRAFDYAAQDDKAHKFDDAVQDCAFASDKLILVGDSLGAHDNDPNLVMRHRMTLLEIDVNTDEHTFTVADKGPGKMTQSSATSVAIDDEGHYVVGLYTCEDQCDPAGEFRIYAPGGVLLETPLVLGADILPPVDVAWNPGGGYVVVASARGGGWNTEFFVEAYFPGEPLPVWTYATSEGAGPNLAETLALLPGIVIAGGLSGAGFPALAFIYG